MIDCFGRNYVELKRPIPEVSWIESKRSIYCTASDDFQAGDARESLDRFLPIHWKVPDRRVPRGQKENPESYPAPWTWVSELADSMFYSRKRGIRTNLGITVKVRKDGVVGCEAIPYKRSSSDDRQFGYIPDDVESFPAKLRWSLGGSSVRCIFGIATMAMLDEIVREPQSSLLVSVQDAELDSDKESIPMLFESRLDGLVIPGKPILSGIPLDVAASQNLKEFSDRWDEPEDVPTCAYEIYTHWAPLTRGDGGAIGFLEISEFSEQVSRWFQAGVHTVRVEAGRKTLQPYNWDSRMLPGEKTYDLDLEKGSSRDLVFQVSRLHRACQVLQRWHGQDSRPLPTEELYLPPRARDGLIFHRDNRMLYVKFGTK